LNIPDTHLHNVLRVALAVPLIRTSTVAVQVQLVHPEGDRQTFWLPQLPVGIPIAHAKLLHDPATGCIVDIVGCRDVRYAITLQLTDHGPARLGHDSPVPELPSQPIAHVPALIALDVDVPDHPVILLQADGIPIPPVIGFIGTLIEIIGILQRFQGMPRQEAIHLRISVELKQSFHVACGESAQEQTFGL